MGRKGRRGSPTFCTPVFSTPKKNDAEVWRLIDDFREPNERLQKWRVRYERLSHLAATGSHTADTSCGRRHQTATGGHAAATFVLPTAQRPILDLKHGSKRGVYR